LTTVRVFALIILIVATAAAQDRMPGKLSIGTGEAGGVEGGSPLPAVSTATATLPDAPAPHRVIDKKFIFVMGALAGAEAVRFTSRKLVLDNEFAAGAPWVTHVPAYQPLVAKYAGLYATELLVAYEIKKPHSWLPGDKVVRKLWWAYPLAMAAIHVKNGVGNMRTEGPGGCTSMECAEQMQ
jgi:hypothetical protein